MADKINYKPTAGYMLLEPEATETRTPSGIVLPDNVGEKPQVGRVIAVGEAEVTDAGVKKTSPAQVNDFVVYKKWGGNEFKINGKEYLFVKFEDILAIQG